MLVSNIKCKGYRCFNSEWVGFDRILPINVIIGRNNSGKSHVIDFVKAITSAKLAGQDWHLKCVCGLSEEYLKMVFPETSKGGSLSSYNSHWIDHGRHLIGHEIEWEYDKNANSQNLVLPAEFPRHGHHHVQLAREQAIREKLSGVKSVISSKIFRRLAADRDIKPESASNANSFDESGSGATNIIRRFIVNANMNRSVIQEELLAGLQYIFGQDAKFNEIIVRQQSKDGMESGIWEVFLGEKNKGLIPLSNSGSGLKTVILMLLHLHATCVLESQHKSNYVFAFEELENNLHPSLLRRLFSYLSTHVATNGCHLFLTTHSSVALDFFGSLSNSQIIHVSHDGTTALAKTITTHFSKSSIITELGARPSDLLQANGIIWLEGPSDRIYFNKLIDIYSDGQLREGKDYQCAL
jgi:predicted ATPase